MDLGTYRAKGDKNIMAIENFNEVKEYFETNKDNEEVKGYVGGFITSDRVNNFLDGEDGKKLLQPKLDTYSAKGLESWKTNNLDKLYQERFTKENPASDPKDVAMAQLKAEFEAMKNESSRKDLTNTALKLAEQKKLPSSLVDFFIGTDEATTTKNLETLEKVFSTQVEAIVLERLKCGYKAPKGDGGGATYTKEQISKMSTAEFNKAYDTNREAIQSAMSSK